jgi:cell division protein FtsI (penicillin-binding protein 3)
MNRAYKIRAFFIFFLFCVAYFFIAYTVYVISIAQQDFFDRLSHQQYSTLFHLCPERGIIYDRNGKPLALNKDGMAAFITPTKIKNPQELEHFLKTHFPATLERWQKHPQANFVYVARRLSDKQLDLINQQALEDIYLLQEPQRLYPVPAAASIVGVTDVDNHGLFGVELIFDAILSGTPTTMILERDARGGHYYFKQETQVSGSPGAPVYLTIDSDLQFLVNEEVQKQVRRFQAQEGAAIVLDPTTGDILALVSYPGFDPYDIKPENLEQTRAIPITDAYELGSVIKTFVALALLQEKLIEPDELIDCQNKKIAYVQGVKISTWKEHGLLTLPEIIQYSNNIGIATLALRLGSLLYDHYCRLGFGKKCSLSWPGQQAGFVNPPENWSNASPISLSFGYESRATLLQLAQAFSIIALDGIVKEVRLYADQNTPEPHHIYDAEAIKALQQILERTVQQGTAYKARLQGYRVMGKTGTANLVIDGKYNTEHNIYTFAGIIQKNNFQRVIVTFIKDVGRGDVYASTIAVPLFERIAQIVLIHDKVVTQGE